MSDSHLQEGGQDSRGFKSMSHRDDVVVSVSPGHLETLEDRIKSLTGMDLSWSIGDHGIFTKSRR